MKHQVVENELIIVDRSPYQVRVGCMESGVVRTDYVRIVKLQLGGVHEVAYWSTDEIAEDVRSSARDSSTAFNAIMSAIELVLTDNFREDK